MAKLHILGQSENKQGGGWSWCNNMCNLFETTTPEEADVYVITSVSMLPKLSVIPKDKPVVLRVDNVLKKSCNSDVYPFEGDKVSRMEALKLVAQRADRVVFQTEWAKDYLNPYLEVPESKIAIILNSTDEKVFNEKGAVNNPNIYLYSRSSNHDNKQWHGVYYFWQYHWRKNQDDILWIAGRFSIENVPNKFDFFQGEKHHYLGFLERDKMAIVLKEAGTFIYSYHMDCCSNSLIEALLSGCDIKYLDKSGGAEEIDNAFLAYGKEYFYLERMKKEYQEVFNAIV